MKAPENLVQAVERLKPQAVLLLDTNILMDFPKLESYEIAAPGPFLLVVPEVAYSEVMNITKRKGTDERKKQKARRTIRAMDEVLGHGVKNGIELANGHWVITCETPARLRFEDMSIEEHLLWKNLKEVDTALLRLSDACVEDIPNTRTLLVTRDKNLTRSARVKGVPTCPLPDLHSPEGLQKLLTGVRLGGVASIDDIATELDPAEKRAVKVAMTLKELRGEGDDMIARGSGRLTFSDEEYSFDWKYPYKNVERVEDLDSLFEILGNTDMPIENLYFEGEDEERVPEQLRLFACSILEDAGWNDLDSTINATLFWSEILDEGIEWEWFWHRGLYSLLSPQIRIRLAFMYMEGTLWGYSQPILSDEIRQPLDELDDLSQLCKEYIKCCKAMISYALPSLPSKRETHDMFNRAIAKEMTKDVTKYGDGAADFIAEYDGDDNEDTDRNGTGYNSIGDAYLKAFHAYKALSEHLGHQTDCLDSGLMWLLNVASDSWTVGQTREWESSYRPFALPQEDGED